MIIIIIIILMIIIIIIIILIIILIRTCQTINRLGRGTNPMDGCDHPPSSQFWAWGGRDSATNYLILF